MRKMNGYKKVISETLWLYELQLIVKKWLNYNKSGTNFKTCKNI